MKFLNFHYIEIFTSNIVCLLIYRWSELQVWNQGVVVKHVQGLFRSAGVNNAAEPDNKMHARFYVSV